MRTPFFFLNLTSRGHLLIVLRQPAQPFLALDLSLSNRRQPRQRHIPKPLVRPFVMVMQQKLAHDVIQLRFSHDDKNDPGTLA